MVGGYHGKGVRGGGVPKSILEKNKNKEAIEHSNSLGSRKLTFPVELDRQLVILKIWKYNYDDV